LTSGLEGILRQAKQKLVAPPPPLSPVTSAAYVLVVPPPGDAPDIDGLEVWPGILSFLEMYGIVGTEVCTADDLPAVLRRSPRTVVFVARHRDWSAVEHRLARLQKQAACVVIEGPVSETIAATLKLNLRFRAVDSTKCDIVDAHLRDRIGKLLDGYVGTSIDLGPIRASMRPETAGDPPVPIESPFHAAIPVTQTFTNAAHPIMSVAGEGTRSILAVTGNMIVASHPILTLIAQRLGVGAATSPIGVMSGERNGEALDYLLLHTIADVAARHGRPLVTVEPWPAGVSHVVSIRYDVDRVVAPDDWARLRAWHRANGLRASWYFLTHSVDKDRIAELAADGHEIAHHYTNLRTKGEAERAAIEAALPGSGSITGACCHGGNFHGQSDLDWFAAHGYAYSEILARCTLFPFRPITQGVGERAERPDLYVTARHLSVDAKVVPPTADFSYGNRTRPARLRTRGHNVVMNHPDINFEAMSAAVESYMTEGAENWTQAEVVDWWRATHSEAASLVVDGSPEGGLVVRLLSAADRPPALRIWSSAAVEGGVPADNLGASHVVVPCDALTLPPVAVKQPLEASPVFSLQPFRVGRGGSVVFTIDGDNLKHFKTLRLVRGKDVHYDVKLAHDGDDGATATVDVPAEALQGLYNAVLISPSGRALLRNAIMILDEKHHDGTYLELVSYYTSWRYVLDSEGIPMKDMGYDIGFVRHPLVATYFIQSYNYKLFETEGPQAREGIWRLIAWLETQTSEGPRGSLLIRHAFAVKSLNLSPGWISGLTQGRVAEMFVLAWELSKDPRYLTIAERLCRIMDVPVPEGGLLASDIQGNVAIEEFSTEPPHWALNGIGSAINSLEYVASFVDMPWERDLIDRVCRSIDAKIDMFDVADYPGSRVQLAMKYDLSLRLVPSGGSAAAGGQAVRIHSARMKPWFSSEFPMDVAHATYDKKLDAIRFESILDANRDPLDGVSRAVTVITMDVGLEVGGRLVLSTSHNGEEVLLGEASANAGDQQVTFMFDVAECLPSGIGRVAKYNEPYHETNLAWMWQLSRYGQMPRNAFMARRWLFSLLNGKGRLPLAGTKFDQSKLLARRALKVQRQQKESEASKGWAAGATVEAIDKILSLADRSVVPSISHLTPTLIAADRPAKVRLFGFGFNGSEAVEITSASGEPTAGIASRVVSGDEIEIEVLGLPPGEYWMQTVREGTPIAPEAARPPVLTVR
jgi:hypothetical protein